jgi:hypothetical protein
MALDKPLKRTASVEFVDGKAAFDLTSTNAPHRIYRAVLIP